METCTYKSVQDKANLLFTAKAAATVDDQAALRVFINSRYREYYEYFWWPDVTVVERRFFRQPWSAATAYQALEQVYWWVTQSYYQALRPTQLTIQAIDEFTPGVPTVSFAAPHLLEVGDCFTISGASPAVYNGDWVVAEASATELTYVMAAAGPGGANPSLGMKLSVNPTCRSSGSGQVAKAYWAESQPEYTAEDWRYGRSYAVGDTVYANDYGEYYRCITATSTDGVINTAYWTRLVPFERRIDYVTGNQGDTATPLGRIRRAWDANPRIHTDAVWRNVRLAHNGVIVDGKWPYVWLEFRLRPNEFLGSNYAAGTSYSPGDTVYYAADGDFYINIQVTSSQPPTNSSYWTKLQFPLVLRDAVAQAAMADMLKVSGQTSKYGAEIQEARRLLMIELDRIERQQGQAENLNVMTR